MLCAVLDYREFSSLCTRSGRRVFFSCSVVCRFDSYLLAEDISNMIIWNFFFYFTLQVSLSLSLLVSEVSSNETLITISHNDDVANGPTTSIIRVFLSPSSTITTSTSIGSLGSIVSVVWHSYETKTVVVRTK